MINIAAIAEIAIAAGLLAFLVVATIEMVRYDIEQRRNAAAYAARIASPEYQAASAAAKAAWANVNATRVNGYATVAAMDAYRAARRNRDALAR